jgi:hypothetical protein
VLERDTTQLAKGDAALPAHPLRRSRAHDQRSRERGDLVPGYEDLVPTIEWGDDFGSPHETYLAAQFDKPVFVHHYPTQVKAFYMEPEPDRPEVCRSVDLLAPEGYGEIIGGSERMSDASKLLAAIERHKLPLEPMNGTSICAAMARSSTAALAWAWSAPWPGSAASTTCAKPSPSRAC